MNYAIYAAWNFQVTSICVLLATAGIRCTCPQCPKFMFNRGTSLLCHGSTSSYIHSGIGLELFEHSSGIAELSGQL
eukprot:3112945-Amphidinium_carterae.1